LAGLFVLPSLQAKAAFDDHLLAFAQEIGFSLWTPDLHVDEDDLLFLFTLECVNAIDGNADVGHRGPA
jgi:hypothetical protein